MTITPDKAHVHSIAVRIEQPDDRIAEVAIIVTDLDGDSWKVALGESVIGFVHQAGRVFVALLGDRIDLATECAQTLLWDHAVAHLISTADVDPVLAAAPHSDLPDRAGSADPAAVRRNARAAQVAA